MTSAAARIAVGIHLPVDPVFEFGIKIAGKQIRRFHNVHVTVYEPESFFHDMLLATERFWEVAPIYEL